MTVDRDMFAIGFFELPEWSCPTCGRGHLKISKEKLLITETGPSAAAWAHEAWEAEWVEKRFAGLMTCDSTSCGEVVAVHGDISVVESWDDDHPIPRPVHSEWFKPRSLSPAPLLFRPPRGTPELVQNALREAAGLLWQSAEGAANQVRQAVEHLMDHQGVTMSRPGAYLSLHHRIKELETRDPNNAEILLAVKWLGNSGSHAGGLTRQDVFDAFEMVELVLTNLFDRSKATIMEKVKAVNIQRGPVKPDEEEYPF